MSAYKDILRNHEPIYKKKREEMKTNLRWSSFYEELHKLWLDIFYIF
jgi:hypothetical protein